MTKYLAASYLMISIMLLSSCSKSDQTTPIPKSKADSIYTKFDSGFASFPCVSIPVDSTSNESQFVDPQEIALFDYIRYSCEQRLDTIPFDVKSQLIPLQLGNTWKYKYSQNYMSEITKDVGILVLSTLMPDTLMDTATIPLQGCITMYTNLKKSRKTCVEMHLGIRKWFISSTPGQFGNYSYVFSSDPRGTIIGLLAKRNGHQQRVSNRDTVLFMDFITNEPHRYDSCGNRTRWQSPLKIETPSGQFLCHVYARNGSYDTLYFAYGIGVVRSAVRYDNLLNALELSGYSTQ